MKIIAKLIVIFSVLLLSFQACLAPKPKNTFSFVLEVDAGEMIKSMSSQPEDILLNQAIGLANENRSSGQKEYINLFGDAFSEIGPNIKLASLFMTHESAGWIDFGSSNDEVLKYLKENIEAATENICNILLYRLEEAGISKKKTILTRQPDNRINLEITTNKEDPNQLADLLTTQAKLEFWETYDNSEIQENMLLLNSYFKTYQLSKEEPDMEIVNSQEFDHFFTQNLLIPNIDPNSSQARTGPKIGYTKKADFAEVNAVLNLAIEDGLFPNDIKFAWGLLPVSNWNLEPSDVYSLVALQVTERNGQAPVDDYNITKTWQETDRATGYHYVFIEMDTEGAEKWAALTKKCAEKNPRGAIAIVLDDRVYSAPIVQSEITGGRSQISGSFTAEEAKDLANVLSSGRLPAPVSILQMDVVKAGSPE